MKLHSICLQCDRENKIKKASYLVVTKARFGSGETKRFLCRDHLLKLTLNEINRAIKLNDSADSINSVIKERHRNNKSQKHYC